MAIRKERNRHLTDDLRLDPEAALRARKSFSQIKREPGIPRSTGGGASTTPWSRRRIPSASASAPSTGTSTRACSPSGATTSRWPCATRNAAGPRRSTGRTAAAPGDGSGNSTWSISRRIPECGSRRSTRWGESSDSLAQEHVNTMMSHVNSHVRASLVKGVAPCRTPYERFAFECGGQIAGRLGIVPVPLEEATLRPELLEMNRSPPDKVRPKAIDGGRPVSTPEGESRASPWNRHAHFPMQKCTEYANLHLESLQFHANPYRQIP